MKLHNLRADVARWGWMRSLFIRVMARLQRYAGLYIYRIGVRPLVRHPPEPNLPRGISLRVVQREELLKAADDPELEMPIEFVRSALARGDMAFGAFEGHHLVSYSWRTFTAAPHIEDLWARVNHPYYAGYKAFTRPSYRGKRIHPAVALFSDAYLLERGYTAEAGSVDISNFSSLGTARFLGRQRIGFAGYVRWFGHYVHFRTSAVRKIGFEFFKPHE